MCWYSFSDMPDEMLPAEDPRDLDALLVDLLQLFFLVEAVQQLKVSAVMLVDVRVPQRKNEDLRK